MNTYPEELSIMPCLTSRSAISVIELLVVIAIFAVFTALVVPAIQRIRDAAACIKCQNNLRQIGLALHAHHDATRSLPQGCSFLGGSDPLPHLSWCARLLPHLEEQALWAATLRAFAEEPFFLGAPHLNVRTRILAIFACPSDAPVLAPKETGAKVAFTSYLGSEGIDQYSADGTLFLDSRVRLTDVKDGTAHTVLVGERPPSADLAFGWWYAGWGQAKDGSAEMILGAREQIVHRNFRDCPTDSTHFRPGRTNEQCDALHFWSAHFGGAGFLFCDGSVRFLAYSADPIMPALATRAGGEAVSAPE